jgi:cytochrome c biogenesis protein CcdA
MLLLILSCIAGMLTVLTPCVLPLLPIIIGGSMVDGKNLKKILTILTALSISIIIFTLLLKATTALIDIPNTVWKSISGGIVAFLGLTYVFPNIWENAFLSRVSTVFNKLIGKGTVRGNAMGDVLVGMALGPVFTTCSPTYALILATVLPASFSLGFVYLLAYTFGLSLILFLVGYIGQSVAERLSVLSDPRGVFKKTMGIIFILVGISIWTGVDKEIEAWLLNLGLYDVTRIEQSILRVYEK